MLKWIRIRKETKKRNIIMVKIRAILSLFCAHKPRNDKTKTGKNHSLEPPQTAYKPFALHSFVHRALRNLCSRTLTRDRQARTTSTWGCLDRCLCLQARPSVRGGTRPKGAKKRPLFNIVIFFPSFFPPKFDSTDFSQPKFALLKSSGITSFGPLISAEPTLDQPSATSISFSWSTAK